MTSDIFKFTNILFIFFFTLVWKTEATEWSLNKIEYNKGPPVLYEAYYPDEQVNTNYNIEKKYFDRGPINDKSIEIPYIRQIFTANLPIYNHIFKQNLIKTPINLNENSNLNDKFLNDLYDKNINYYYDNLKSPINILTNKIDDKHYIEKSEKLLNPLENSITDFNSESLPTENVFQPRPQIINYVMSNNQEPEVTSIQIKKEKPHKIRHHHDKKLKYLLNHYY